MKKYVGSKLVQAEPLSINGEEGYKVVYNDGYESWSPKKVFENYYMEVGENNTVTETNVSDFVTDYEVKQWGDKTTIVKATLKNGFIIVESSSCVDPDNFNMDLGYNICRERIQNKIWEMLGFLLQTANKGLKDK